MHILVKLRPVSAKTTTTSSYYVRVNSLILADISARLPTEEVADLISWQLPFIYWVACWICSNNSTLAFETCAYQIFYSPLTIKVHRIMIWKSWWLCNRSSSTNPLWIIVVDKVLDFKPEMCWCPIYLNSHISYYL